MSQHFVYALVDGPDVRYVGYSARIEGRRKDHAYEHPGWRMITLGCYPTREDGLEHEVWWIKRLFDKGHPLTNVSAGGTAEIPGRTPSYLTARKPARLKGLKRTPETCARMGASKKGNKFNVGRRPSPQTLTASSLAKKGVPLKPEHRAKLSAAAKERWSSPEERAKQSLRTKNTWTDEVRTKQSADRKGKPWSEARRAAQKRKDGERG